MLVAGDFFYIPDIAQVLLFLCQGVVFRFQLLDFLFCPHAFLMDPEDPVSLMDRAAQ